MTIRQIFEDARLQKEEQERKFVENVASWTLEQIKAFHNEVREFGHGVQSKEFSAKEYYPAGGISITGSFPGEIEISYQWDYHIAVGYAASNLVRYFL